jgi:hypothetical protein
MAKMIPPVIPKEVLESKKLDGEKIVYQLLEKRLGQSWTVIYSQEWLGNTNTNLPIREGETDFILLHPEHGILILEVKGGVEITYNQFEDKWFSLSKSGVLHDIIDPFSQARGSKNAILNLIKSNSKFSDLNSPYKEVVIGYCVAFPEFDTREGSLGFYNDENITITKKDLQSIEKRILEIIDFYKQNISVNRLKTRDVVNNLISLKSSTVKFRGTLRSWIESENVVIHQATESQIAVLRVAKDFADHIYISGCAGSGKTLIATTLAEEFALEGKKVLLVCFNTLLGKSFEIFSKKFSLIEAGSYYDVLYRIFKYSRNIDFSDNDSVISHILENDYDKFDVLIIDEAQDLQPEQIDILRLLEDKEGKCIIFSDDNQRVMNTNPYIPKGFRKHHFSDNLRNTQKIFDQVKQYHHQPESIVSKGPTGRKVEITEKYQKGNYDQMFSIIRSKVNQLVFQENINVDNIVILTPKSVNNSALKQLNIQNISFCTFSDYPKENSIRIDTVRRFKGLESDVVILTETDEVDMKDLDLKNSLLYVGMSRAKNHLIIVPSSDTTIE